MRHTSTGGAVECSPFARRLCKLEVAVLWDLKVGSGAGAGFFLSSFLNCRSILGAEGRVADVGMPSVLSMPRMLLRAFFQSLWKSESAPDRGIGNVW